MLTQNRCAKHFPALLLFAVAIALAKRAKSADRDHGRSFGRTAQAFSCGDGFSSIGRAC